MRFNFLIFVVSLGMLSTLDYLAGYQILNFREFEPRLHQYNDTTYIIHFWATWCIPCRKELPDFDKINTAYKDQKVKVLLVSLDFPDNLSKSLFPFVQQNNIQSEIIVLDDPDSNFWINQIDSSWNGNIPATLIYNKHHHEFIAEMVNYEFLDSILKLKTTKQ
ncbi:MAG TPA: TlpA disulfide reductase family protein [Bacteroidales bacterium]|nr:TlpA disulfide reductase family protein [Bacteroidales bacterium]